SPPVAPPRPTPIGEYGCLGGRCGGGGGYAVAPPQPAAPVSPPAAAAPVSPPQGVAVPPNTATTSQSTTTTWWLCSTGSIQASFPCKGQNATKSAKDATGCESLIALLIVLSRLSFEFNSNKLHQLCVTACGQL
ncbi:hypothetical protein OSTOST_12344, partial [Ostertagia ostertagi]